MADQEHMNFGHTSHENGSTSPQPHSFNNLDFQDLSSEGVDFLEFQGFFDITEGVLPAPPSSDTPLPIGNPGVIEGGHYTDQYVSHENYLHVVSENATDDFDDGIQDLVFESEDLESIIPNHYGVGYWLSVCSSPGIAWVRRQFGSNEFAEIARDLKSSWAKQLRLERTEPTSKTAEPEPQLVWKYCNAYFERSVDNVWDTVYRPEFERQLRAYLSGKMQYYDPAWYALRNVVYAAGCRIYRSECLAANFADVHREAWGYFSNALSVHSELLLTKPTLRSVRALLTMAFFAEGLASPALSSGLISNAALLAQSLGLHHKTTDTGVHADSDAVQRSWLFWAVYCSEKHIAQRCGRPSVINDDDITCGIPTIVHPGSTIELEMLTYIIQTCQFHDQISRQLLSTRALHEPPAKMLSLVTQFNIQLQSWKESMPSQLRPTDFLKHFRMPGTNRLLGLMTAHCSFYDMLMINNSIFMYPWVIDSFSVSNLDTDLALKIKAQIIISSHLVANAARSLIVIARNLDMNRAGTQSFMLHFPMHAFINLFIYVIGNPELPSVQSDLALLDVAAGYFGQMEFVTGSKLCFPFARDIAALARTVVEPRITASPKIPSEIPHDVQMNESWRPNATQYPEVEDLDLDSWIS